MNTSLLYRLLDADPADGPAELLRRARACHHLPHLVLSALVRDGVRMGEPARAELRRARDRAAHYARLAAGLARATGVRAIRGLPLAGYYPDGLLRPLGTLDLVAPDEAALWQAVIRLVTEHPVEQIDVALLGDRPRHTTVTVHWPAEDPLVDPWYRVHLTTAALPGDGSAVPVRPYLVADEHVECLIALAESRLHRPALPPGPVALLDIAGLTRRPFEPTETAAVLAAYRLAPEAATLLDAAADHLPLGPLAAVRTALAPELAPERRRRTQAAAPHLPTRRGVLLRRTAIRHSWDEARLLTLTPGTLLLTPVADYLLVPTPGTPGTPGTRAAPATRTAALKALQHWDSRC
ncbi:hypothetical protein HHX38_29470 [Streptomyces sp. PKU-MA01144]|uniref:hypothetical protein n=1 Tax=Streptomyces TaxID=1883 RepID=UPI0014810BFB|nr:MULTISPECIES: hypothetical protein [Streptomyces]MCY0983933.1 hypothetical protein [Streptomyces tirandamycinicus]NNJ08216.1 hypothetical protein [Streptomyces sp. PKU-MA01144]